MNKISKGNVVKFVDADGAMNGGTVVEFTRKDNEEYALINTLDGKKISKKKDSLQLIKRQQRGRISAKYMEELKEEIRIENVNTPKQSVNKEPVIEESVGQVQVIVDESDLVKELREELLNKDVKVKTYEAELHKNREYIRSLEAQVENRPESKNVTNLLMTVKGLSEALLAASLNKEGDMVQELLKVIAKLNDINE